MSEPLAVVVARGDRLETLTSLRDYTAQALDECVSARDRKSLLSELREVLREIAELAPPTEEVDPLADLIPDDN